MSIITRAFLASLLALGLSGQALADGIENPTALPAGIGTVTSVSVVTANGVSGVVANATTTPAITLTLGAITPSTVTIGAGSVITSSGPGGALGSNAFTSTAYLPLTGGTLTGTLTVSSASFGLSGNISAPAWTTAGIRYANVTATLTDTTSSGTVAAARTDNFGGNTIAASSAVTFTAYYSAYFSNPIAGTNVTLTNKSAIGADSISIGGQAQSTFALAINGTTNHNGATTLGGAITYGGVTLSNSVTGTGSMVLQTNASLITPALGVATATSLAIGGTTLSGSYALGVGAGAAATRSAILLNGGANTGQGVILTMQVGGTDVNYVGTDSAVNGGTGTGLVLYTSSTGKLQIATGAGVNAQITASGFSIGANGNHFLTSPGAAILQLGAADAAGAGVAQTLKNQGSTGATMAGVTFTLAGPDTSFAGTATGGDIDIRAGNATGASGTRTGGNAYIDGGTGPSAGGSVIIRTAATTSLAAALTIAPTKAATFGLTVAVNNASQFYKQTNAGGNIATAFAIAPIVQGAGRLSVDFDESTTTSTALGYNFSVFNSASNIVRTSAVVGSSPSRTAGSETGQILLATKASAGSDIVAGLTIDPNRNVILNNAAIATSATDGFLYIASGAGAPIGTPTAFTGRVALYYDTTNHQFWIYDGAWLQPKTPAGARKAVLQVAGARGFRAGQSADMDERRADAQPVWV